MGKLVVIEVIENGVGNDEEVSGKVLFSTPLFLKKINLGYENVHQTFLFSMTIHNRIYEV